MDYPTKQEAIKFAKRIYGKSGYEFNADTIHYCLTDYTDGECAELVLIERRQGKSALDDGELSTNIRFYENGKCLFIKESVVLNVTDSWKKYNNIDNKSKETLNTL